MNKFVLLSLAILIFGSNAHVLAQEQALPTWLRNTAILWGQEEISDKEFFDLLQYLIDSNNIIIPQLNSNDDSTIQYFNDPPTYPTYSPPPQYSYALTYMIADIPTEFNKQIIHDGIYDGFNIWSDLNPQFTFSQINVGEPDIMITWMPYDDDTLGLGCIDCIHDGATIELVLAKDDCNGNQVQLGKEHLRNTVAHEFGHNVGLEHHVDEDHLMYSDEDPITPYDDLGYNIPVTIEPLMVGETFYKVEFDKLDKQLEPLNQQHDKLDNIYNMLKKQQDLSETQYETNIIQYEKLVEQYENNWLSYDVINTKYGNLEIERKKLNEHITLTNQVVNDKNILNNQINIISDEYNHILDKVNCLHGEHTTFGDEIL